MAYCLTKYKDGHMNRLALIKLLSSRSEEDVFVLFDEQEYEIEDMEHLPEAFDGFFSYTPEAVGLKITPKNCEI